MKTAMSFFTIFAVACLFAVSTQAGPPMVGTYTSEASQVSHGRHTESFANDGDFLTIGNAINAASWNGAALGMQWSYSCPDIASTLLLIDLVNPITGDGQKIYKKTFTGGTFMMNGTGEAWDGGDATYTGVITYFSETTTIIFSNFQRINADTDITWSGYFDGPSYPCVQWAANGATLGDTSGGSTLPAGFPPFVNPTDCSLGRTHGIWWQDSDVTMTIFDCTVPTEESTWGNIKALFE
jgi:hypothetical protein